jgi:hypothetical protein
VSVDDIGNSIRIAIAGLNASIISVEAAISAVKVARDKVFSVSEESPTLAATSRDLVLQP